MNSVVRIVVGITALVVLMVLYYLFPLFMTIALLTIFFIIIVSAAVIYFVVPIRWYFAVILANFNFIFTIVPEGYFKIVVRFGGHYKTLLSKRDHIIANNGNIEPATSPPLTSEELVEAQAHLAQQPSGGLRVIGWPFIDKIFEREMVFLKSMPSGTVKRYDVPGVKQFFARVDYPYAIVFEKCEDKNNLPLLGHATLLAHVLNPYKSFFATANFYETMVGLVLPAIRECLKSYSYDELKKLDNLDEIMWQKLQETNTDVPGGVINELRDKYGVLVIAFRVVNIDPSPEYRDLTLTKWKAEREADAAKAAARSEEQRAAGPIDRAMARWVRREASEHGETVAVAKKRLRDSGEYGKHEKLLADQINRSRKTVQERKIDITSGGEPMQGGSVAGIAGSIAAAIIGAVAGKNIKEEDQEGGKNSGGKNSGKKKNPKDMDDDELFDDIPGD